MRQPRFLGRLSFSVFVDKLLLGIPESLRKVNIVGMRIFKSLDLVPKRVHLSKAVALDIVNVLIFANPLAVDEKRLEKLTC